MRPKTPTLALSSRFNARRSLVLLCLACFGPWLAAGQVSPYLHVLYYTSQASCEAGDEDFLVKVRGVGAPTDAINARKRTDPPTHAAGRPDSDELLSPSRHQHLDAVLSLRAEYHIRHLWVFFL